MKICLSSVNEKLGINLLVIGDLLQMLVPHLNIARFCWTVIVIRLIVCTFYTLLRFLFICQESYIPAVVELFRPKNIVNIGIISSLPAQFFSFTL